MKFEWDENKNKSNSDKHGIDFETATQLWADENRIEIEAPYPLEHRYVIIGKIEQKHWTAIFTKRGNAARLISVRRSRKKEEALYEEDRQK